MPFKEDAMHVQCTTCAKVFYAHEYQSVQTDDAILYVYFADCPYCNDIREVEPHDIVLQDHDELL